MMWCLSSDNKMLWVCDRGADFARAQSHILGVLATPQTLYGLGDGAVFYLAIVAFWFDLLIKQHVTSVIFLDLGCHAFQSFMC